MNVLRFSMLAIGALFLEFSLSAETPLATIFEILTHCRPKQEATLSVSKSSNQGQRGC